MLITKFWVVKNPTDSSELEDICWETTPFEFVKYILGAQTLGEAAFLEQENFTFHTAEHTAWADAVSRLQNQEAKPGDV
jgi:hypothetical protein